MIIIRFIKSLYFSKWLYLLLLVNILLFIAGNYLPLCYAMGKTSLLAIVVLVITDILFLYSNNKGILATREMQGKLSNGDNNDIFINIKNNYAFNTTINIIDEIPFQFQRRDFIMKLELRSGQEKRLMYILKPLKRGEYKFGKMNVYVSGLIKLISKKYTFENNFIVHVYPSYIQMKKYQLLAVSNRLSEAGIKNIRRLGHTMEFDQIRNYVPGDDFRTVNWKATARKQDVMVNQYQDERSQYVYSIIDMGRMMKMPFEGMTLLDYAINSSLVISNIAIYKHDKAGLITFSNKINAFLPAEKQAGQMHKILEVLYNQNTDFAESDYELLYISVKRKIKQRSLLIVYTNFESMSSLNRQLEYLKQLTKQHLVLVVFFENSEIKKLLATEPVKLEEIYIKAIAEKFVYEKKQIIKELRKNGIHAILTKPQNLSVNLINKYLELKAARLI